MPNHKHFFQPGEAITEEQRELLRNLQDKQTKELNDLLATIPAKKVPEFMNPPFHPYEDRVLVFPDPTEMKTNSGIIIPDEVKDRIKPVKGTVVRVGPGKLGSGLAVPLQEGDRIYYGSFAGTELEINGITYLIMRFGDCFGGAE